MIDTLADTNQVVCASWLTQSIEHRMCATADDFFLLQLLPPMVTTAPQKVFTIDTHRVM